MTPPIEPGPAQAFIDGQPIGTLSAMSIAEIMDDDVQGLLLDDSEDDSDEEDDEDDPIEQATPVDMRPEATQNEITAAMLRELSITDWNFMVADMRAEEPDWYPVLADQTFYDLDLRDRDLRGASFRATTLDHTNLSNCDLTDANFAGASLYQTRFTDADVTGSNYKDAISWEDARWLRTDGYVPPLVDCTEQVARQCLVDAINDPDSIVNDGLRMLVDNGLSAEWRGSKLHFWMTHQMQRFIDPCEESECDCEYDHACVGGCECCACYRNECDCERDHCHEIEETSQMYLATVIGHVEFRWDDRRGLEGHVSMDHQTKHPHVSTAAVACWGDAQAPDTIRVADHLLMVMGWIGQHNPASEYRPITDLPRVA